MVRVFFRLFNKAHVLLVRLSGGRLGGRIQGLRVLLLATTGRKTGKRRIVPLGYFEDGGQFIITASNAGLDTHPGWFFNLRANPRVRIQVGGRLSEAEGRIVDGEERARLWSRLVSLSPGYGRYARSTRRVIPLIALRAADG